MHHQTPPGVEQFWLHFLSQCRGEVDGWMNIWVWVDGWMGGWVGGWMGGWVFR